FGGRLVLGLLLLQRQLAFVLLFGALGLALLLVAGTGFFAGLLLQPLLAGDVVLAGPLLALGCLALLLAIPLGVGRLHDLLPVQRLVLHPLDDAGQVLRLDRHLFLVALRIGVGHHQLVRLRVHLDAERTAVGNELVGRLQRLGGRVQVARIAGVEVFLVSRRGDRANLAKTLGAVLQQRTGRGFRLILAAALHVPLHDLGGARHVPVTLGHLTAGVDGVVDCVDLLLGGGALTGSQATHAVLPGLAGLRRRHSAVLLQAERPGQEFDAAVERLGHVVQELRCRLHAFARTLLRGWDRRGCLFAGWGSCSWGCRAWDAGGRAWRRRPPRP